MSLVSWGCAEILIGYKTPLVSTLVIPINHVNYYEHFKDHLSITHQHFRKCMFIRCTKNTFLVVRILGFRCVFQCWASVPITFRRVCTWPRDVNLMLVYCWSIVYDAGPTLIHYWLNVSCLLGHYQIGTGRDNYTSVVCSSSHTHLNAVSTLAPRLERWASTSPAPDQLGWQSE